MRFRVSFTRIRYDTPTWGHRTRHQPIPFIRMCYPAAYREEERRGGGGGMRPVKCVKASCSPTPHCFLTCHQLWLLGYDLLLPQLRQ
jgi:hypothetical protein